MDPREEWHEDDDVPYLTLSYREMPEPALTAADDPPPIRVALIGYGLAGSAFHAPLIAADPAMRLSMIVTADPERARGARQTYPNASVVASADAVWDAVPELDLVVVATPNRTHVPLAMAAVDAGLPVVVDKPLAPTVAEAERLVAAARDRDLLLTVFQNRRWDGDFLTVRGLVDEGRLGDVFRFESRFERWRPVPKTGWREQGDPAAAGGILFDLGSHLIDQARVLFGPVRDVYAEIDLRRPGVEVDDDAFIALTHVSGVRSHLWMSAVAGQSGPRFRVLGSRAAYTKYGLDVQEARLRAGASPSEAGWGEEPREHWGTLRAEPELQPVPTRAGDYPAFYQGVVRSLRGAASPPVDSRDAVAGLRVIEAAFRSARERRIVRLEAAE